MQRVFYLIVLLSAIYIAHHTIFVGMHKTFSFILYLVQISIFIFLAISIFREKKTSMKLMQLILLVASYYISTMVISQIKSTWSGNFARKYYMEHIR